MKNIIGMLIILVLLFGFYTNSVKSNKESIDDIISYSNVNSRKNSNKIMFIPYDNRPSSTYYVEKIAKMNDVELLTPPKNIIGNKWERGDVVKIEKWMRENMHKSNTFIISAAMLNHGGIMHQRMYDKNYYKGKKFLFNILKEIKYESSYNKVYVYDTIQRHAVSLWKSEQFPLYENTKKWAELIDKAENFNDEDAALEIKRLEKIIPEEVLKNYKLQRELNHKLQLKLIDYTNKDYIDYLIIGQDDASEYGIHRLEKEKLSKYIKKLNLKDKVKLTCGGDEIGMNLLTLVLQEKNNINTKFKIEYSNENKKDNIENYEDRNINQTVIEHVELFGGKVVKSNEDIKLYIFTPVKANEVKKFVAKIEDDIKNNKKVAIIDLAIKDDKKTFMKYLNEKVDLTKLASYCSWNTTSNTVGIAVSHASAYNVMTKTSNINSNSSMLMMHYNFLYERILRDFIYSDVVADQVIQYLDNNKLDRWNISKQALNDVENFIIKNINNNKDEWLSDFASLGYEFDINNIRLPWERYFDLEINLVVNDYKNNKVCKVNLD